MVIWLIGLSGSGKTTIGRRLQARLETAADRWVLVDGDAFREVMGDAGHTLEERRRNAFRISRLCRMLELQGLNVIACVLSLFPDNRKHNRELFTDYREVYVKVPMEVLERRDNKRLYARARAGELKEVAGVDLDFPEPESPDLVIDNAAETLDFDSLAAKVIGGLGLEVRTAYRYPRPGPSTEHYQYPPFEGAPFLPAYAASREAALGHLEAKLARLESALPGLQGSHTLATRYGLPPLAAHFLSLELARSASAATSVLDTRACLLEVLEAGASTRDGRVSALLRRFEVTKKVHSAYRIPEWRKTADAGESPLDRILLALALLERSAEASDADGLIAFNAVLKLNDSLAANASALATPSELYLACAALRAEREAYARLEAALA
jgi:adenylylsulfate kinase-like enzyme